MAPGGILSAGAGEALEKEDRAARRAWGKSRAPDRPFRAQRADSAAWGASSQLAVSEQLGEAPSGDSGHSDSHCIPNLGTSVDSREDG